jgi:hypothetical protein
LINYLSNGNVKRYKWDVVGYERIGVFKIKNARNKKNKSSNAERKIIEIIVIIIRNLMA